MKLLQNLHFKRGTLRSPAETHSTFLPDLYTKDANFTTLLKSIYFRVFTKQVLRRIHGHTKQEETRCRTALHNKEQHNLYYLPNTSCAVKYRNSHNVHETGNKYKISVLEERNQLRDAIVMSSRY